MEGKSQVLFLCCKTSKPLPHPRHGVWSPDLYNYLWMLSIAKQWVDWLSYLCPNPQWSLHARPGLSLHGGSSRLWAFYHSFSLSTLKVDFWCLQFHSHDLLHPMAALSIFTEPQTITGKTSSTSVEIHRTISFYFPLVNLLEALVKSLHIQGAPKMIFLPRITLLFFLLSQCSLVLSPSTQWVCPPFMGLWTIKMVIKVPFIGYAIHFSLLSSKNPLWMCKGRKAQWIVL